MRKITITNFTDPVCVWCWATEPVFRYLETHYPGDIEFRSICGGLMEGSISHCSKSFFLANIIPFLIEA